MYGDFNFSTVWGTFICYFFIRAILVVMNGSDFHLISHLLMTKDVQYLFRCLWSFAYLLWRNVRWSVLNIFYINLFVCVCVIEIFWCVCVYLCATRCLKPVQVPIYFFFSTYFASTFRTVIRVDRLCHVPGCAL